MKNENFFWLNIDVKKPKIINKNKEYIKAREQIERLTLFCFHILFTKIRVLLNIYKAILCFRYKFQIWQWPDRIWRMGLQRMSFRIWSWNGGKISVSRWMWNIRQIVANATFMKTAFTRQEKYTDAIQLSQQLH